METRLQQLKQDYEPYKAQEEKPIIPYILAAKRTLRIAQLCKGIGLTIDTIKQLLNGKPLSFMGKFHASEHDQSFNVKDAKLQLFKESKDSDRLKRSINGQYFRLVQTEIPRIETIGKTKY